MVAQSSPDATTPVRTPPKAERSAKSVDKNELLHKIQGGTRLVNVLMKYLPAARTGGAVAQYRVATSLGLCTIDSDSRAATEKLLRAGLDLRAFGESNRA